MQSGRARNMDLKFLEEKRKLKQQEKADRERSVFKGQLDLKRFIENRRLDEF